MLRPIWRLGGALALALVAWAGVAPAAAQDVKDPDVALKEINAWYQGEFAKLTPESPANTRTELFRQRTERAKAAVKDADPEKVEPAKGYALAQLFQIAGEAPKAAIAARRYLTTNPGEPNRYSAQNLVLADLVTNNDADGIVAILSEMKAPNASAAASLALMTGMRYASIVSEKKGPQAGLDLIAKVEAAVPFEEMLKKPDVPGRNGQSQAAPERTSAENAIYYLAQGRARILDTSGKPNEALAALESAEKRLPASSMFTPNLVQARASLLEKAGKRDQALGVLETAARNLPDGSPAIAALAQARSGMLEKAGKRDESLAVLEDALKRIPEGSPARRGLNSRIKLAKIKGSPAPALKQDRGYGDFKGLDAYKGKVVVVEFTAHW